MTRLRMEPSIRVRPRERSLDRKHSDEAKEEEDVADSAETWILSGGSWKRKHREDGATSPTPSPFPSRLVGTLSPTQARALSPLARSLSPPTIPLSSTVRKLSPPPLGTTPVRALSPPPGSATVVRALSPPPGDTPPRAFSPLSQRTTRSSASSTPTRLNQRSRRAGVVTPERLLPRNRSSSSKVSDSGASSSRASVSAYSVRTADPVLMRGNYSFAVSPASTEQPLLRSSSSSGALSLSSKASGETKRSNRTSQTEPIIRAAASANAHQIPEVVVEDKKQRRKKSKKPAPSWIKEKDDFFSQTRFSESVARSVAALASENDERSSGSKKNPVTASTTATSRPTSPPGNFPLAVDVRRQRSRSVSPRAQHPPLEHGSPSLCSAELDNSRDETPKRGTTNSRRHRKFRSPSPNKKAADRCRSQAQNFDPSEGLPLLHVNIIRQCFGMDCDLYRDVLKVGRHASEKQLRIAYFRRGRNVLAEDQMERFSSISSATKPGIASLKGLSTETKEKFQAVSLAFELISEPAWRVLYDKHGWSAPLIDVPPRHLSMVQSKTTATADRLSKKEQDAERALRARSISPILRPSVGTAHERRSRSTGRGITWAEQVEELVFRQDPEEIESRRVRSAPPDTSIFQEDWMNKDIDEKIDTSSFMASFLNDLDHSLDGLEASLDGLWSMNSENAEDENQPEETAPVPDRIRATSPVSLDTQGSKETQTSKSLASNLTADDTIPSKLTESGQCSTIEYDRKTSSAPENWNRVGSASSSTLASTIHPDDESEELTAEELFTALTQTTEERRKRESSSRNFATDSHPADDAVLQCSSPSDVKKMLVKEDDLFPQATEKSSVGNLQSRKFQKDDAFDPFEDTMSTIRDTDFESPHELKKVAKRSPRFSVIVEDVDSVASTPSKMSSKGVQNVPSPPRDELFSKDVPEFRDRAQAAPLRGDDDLKASSLNRMHTGLSTLTGTTGSVYDGASLKTTETDNASNITPLNKVEHKDGETVLQRNTKMKSELPGKTDAPCDIDFVSHLLCYADALSTDLTKFGDDFASKVSSTKEMIIESFTFTEENMNDVMRAMEIPDVERSNSI